jgi:phage recombination protein Bet
LEHKLSTALQTVDDQQLLAVLESSLYPGASSASIQMVLGYCKASGLDPMQKPVHIVPMWDGKAKRMRDVVMPGIGLYRTQAARSGECAGVSEPEFGTDIETKIGGVSIIYPQWCKVTVKRRLPSGDIVDFTAKEFWIENYAVKGGQEKSPAPNAMWQKRPYGQIAKCAEAQALRKAFPEIGSSPTAEEMEGKAFAGDDTQTVEAFEFDAMTAIADAKEKATTEDLKAFWTETSPKAQKAGKAVFESVKAAVMNRLDEIKAADDVTDVQPKEEAAQ